ncbi:hypothetical protein E2C01_034935 [Portunus trituberculatus]|uniref:Uncharacterized protein n=1 Tax=Portunus trituberculatus TaxID=210409 RepID=A0A5B7F730_PORTR|nr:hypothetical protein [Portunus trituberculatus]
MKGGEGECSPRLIIWALENIIIQRLLTKRAEAARRAVDLPPPSPNTSFPSPSSSCPPLPFFSSSPFSFFPSDPYLFLLLLFLTLTHPNHLYHPFTLPPFLSSPFLPPSFPPSLLHPRCNRAHCDTLSDPTHRPSIPPCLSTSHSLTPLHPTSPSSTSRPPSHPPRLVPPHPQHPPAKNPLYEAGKTSHRLVTFASVFHKTRSTLNFILLLFRHLLLLRFSSPVMSVVLNRRIGVARQPPAPVQRELGRDKGQGERAHLRHKAGDIDGVSRDVGILIIYDRGSPK